MAHALEVLGFQLYAREHHLPDALLRAVAAAKRDRPEPWS
jgi:hypothetical protein